MKLFGKYEIKNETIIRLSELHDELSSLCADIYNEKNNLTYDELCAVQSIFFDLYYSDIQRLRSDDGRIKLNSNEYETWKNEEDIFDALKKKCI